MSSTSSHRVTIRLLLALLLLAPLPALGEDAPAKAAPAPTTEEKRLSGMSIVGNDEAPKSLVIVPWKSSALGDALGVPHSLAQGRDPVDRDVFLRALSYYEIRTHEARTEP